MNGKRNISWQKETQQSEQEGNLGKASRKVCESLYSPCSISTRRHLLSEPSTDKVLNYSKKLKVILISSLQKCLKKSQRNTKQNSRMARRLSRNLLEGLVMDCEPTRFINLSPTKPIISRKKFLSLSVQCWPQPAAQSMFFQRREGIKDFFMNVFTRKIFTQYM